MAWRPARTPTAHVRRCVVHLEADGDHAVVATCADVGGTSVEVPGAARLVARDPVGLGSAVLDALSASPRWDSLDLSGHRPTDWPSFRASGARSVRAFEAGWHAVAVAGANDRNITWLLSAPVEEELSLRLTAAFAPVTDAAGLGRAVLHLHGRRRLLLDALD